MVKRNACFDACRSDDTINRLAYGECLFATVAVDLRSMFKRSQAAYPENRIGQQDFPGPAEFFVVENALKDFAVNDICKTESLFALDELF